MEGTGIGESRGFSRRAEATFESRGLRGQDAHVQRLKDRAAALWDVVDDISIPPGNSEAGRLVALAKTTLEESVMWAVKALSRNQEVEQTKTG